MLMILTLGLRVSEATKMRCEHIDFSRRSLFVKEAKGKRDRMLPLPQVVIGPLRGWLKGRKKGPVFPSPRGGHLTTRAVQLLFKRTAVKAGLEDALKARKYHPHSFRHEFAVRLLRSGADIMEIKDLLGHSNLQTTTIYLATDPDRMRAAVDRVYS